VSDHDHAAATCAAVRVALSARLDGEEPGLTAEVLDGHLGVCAACCAYRDDLARVHRAARLAPAEEVPDLSAAILAAAPAADHRAGRRTRELQLLVGLAGAVQLALSLPVLFGGPGADIHLGRELGVLQLAIGVGLLVAARQPWRAAGLLPVLFVVVGATLVAATVDVLMGTVSPLAELAHLSELLGVLALWALHRRTTGADLRPAMIAA
jgi:predicted anti-sigma-YlaC factor YlaD